MIDTIKAYAPIHLLHLDEKGSMVNKERLQAYIEKLPSDKIVWGYPNTRLESKERGVFRIWVDQYNNVMIQGSLCKFYFGNNIQTLNKYKVKKAIAMLEQALQLSLADFKVSRLDVSTNIPTYYEVSRYLTTFEGIERWRNEKCTIKEEITGRSFRQTQRSLLLYNKGREVRAKRNKNSNNFSVNKDRQNEEELLKAMGNKVLRIEYRYLKNVGKQIWGEDLYFWQLGYKRVYAQLVRDWFRTLCNLNFREQIIPDLSDIKGVKDLIKALLIGGIDCFGGYTVVMKILEGYCPKDNAEKSKKSRLKKFLTELKHNDILDSLGGELLHEVKRKAIPIALKQLGKRS